MAVDPKLVSGAGQQWTVLYVSPAGPIVYADPNTGEELEAADITGAPPTEALMTLMQAQQLAGQLGPPWIVNHGVTLVTPAEHRKWLAGQGMRWAL